MKRKTIQLERTYEASLDEVWDLWTTKEGFESWWGPDGFVAKVHALDLRPGGEMRYAMSAVGEEQIAFMKKAGMSTSQDVRITYLEVVPKTRLAYENQIDFVPGVAPYSASTVVELEAHGDRVVMRLTLEAMHDEEWTQRALAGWEMQLGKLARVITSAARRPS